MINQYVLEIPFVVNAPVACLLVPAAVGFLIRVDPPVASKKKCMRWMRWRETRNPMGLLATTMGPLFE